MKKLLLILLVCVNGLYAESEDKCLRVNFFTEYPLTKAESHFHFWAKSKMTETAKRFGVGICLDYYGLSKGIEVMEMEQFDSIFTQIERVSGRCFTTNNSKKLKEEIKTYIESLSTKPTILSCLYLYDSKEYDDEIKRIVKKYCKDCE